MLAMSIDELWFHRRRGLRRWERIGHPLDTLTVVLAFAWLAFHHPSNRHTLVVYAVLAGLSCLFVTKDEGIHTRECSAGEHWLHAILFVLHPVVFIAYGAIWMMGTHAMLLFLQLGATIGFGVHQLLYWMVRSDEDATQRVRTVTERSFAPRSERKTMP
jgi:hypothetical protein